MVALLYSLFCSFVCTAVLFFMTGSIAFNPFSFTIIRVFPGKEQMIYTKHYSSREDLEASLHQNLPLFRSYSALHGEWKERFIDFMTGRKTLPLTYDPFFKCIFNPDSHPERLEGLLSSIIGEKVTIKAILPSENVVLSADSLLIMDIIVSLSDDSIANIEIQKIPYQFPAERMSCYSSDLLLRQYTRLKSNNGFTYSDMRKVYTIVLYEKSASEFHDPALNGIYFHHGKTVFDSGLSMELLQEYFIIALDVFPQNGYAKDNNELTMWLSLLATENVSDAEFLIQKYPSLEEIYVEMSGYMCRQEEVLYMFSEALKILDRNTVHYMIEELQKQVEDSGNMLTCMKSEILSNQAEIADMKSKLSSNQAELADAKAELSSNQAELADAKAELSSNQAELAETSDKFAAYIIASVKKHCGKKEDAMTDIMTQCRKTKEEAQALIAKYW